MALLEDLATGEHMVTVSFGSPPICGNISMWNRNMIFTGTFIAGKIPLIAAIM
jgi:hypothetical protein